MNRLRDRQAGMTLVELLVTMAILAIVTVGVLQTLSGFQRAYKLGNYKRQAANYARVAHGYIERDLRLAGYGIDPALGIDFNIFSGSIAGGGSTDCTTAGGGQNSCATTQRDAVNGPDQLVFYARDPEYWVTDSPAIEPAGHAWTLRSTTGGTITVQGHGGDFFPKGQILQIVCNSAVDATYVTVANTVSNAGAAAPISITLEGTQPGNPFKQNGLLSSANGCVQSALSAASAVKPWPRVFLVDRYRYFIQNALLADNVTRQPFLMLDKGVDRDGNGTVDDKDIIAVAPGVSDLQVAYVRAQPPNATLKVGGTNPLRYCVVNAPITQSTSGTCLDGLRIFDFNAIGANRYDLYGYMRGVFAAGSPVRNSADAGNIWGVDVAVVTRSLAEVRELEPTDPPRLLNRTVVPNPPVGRFSYQSFQTVVPTRNMRSHTLSFY